MSSKKYTDAILKQYHHAKFNGMLASTFCSMKGLNAGNLSIHYNKWKRARGIA